VFGSILGDLKKITCSHCSRERSHCCFWNNTLKVCGRLDRQFLSLVEQKLTVEKKLSLSLRILRKWNKKCNESSPTLIINLDYDSPLQGCQMVYLQTKIPHFCISRKTSDLIRLVYFMTVWSFYSILVYLINISYIFVHYLVYLFPFGHFAPRKNLATLAQSSQKQEKRCSKKGCRNMRKFFFAPFSFLPGPSFLDGWCRNQLLKINCRRGTDCAKPWRLVGFNERANL
jgi:hypothetical protein